MLNAMKMVKTMLGLMAVTLLAWGCAPREQQQSLENAVAEPVNLAVSVGGSSRAERFLGTFDEIDNLTLDIQRDLDGKMVEQGFPLLRDNTSTWRGTINSLIVDFDYTVTGHAFKSDNGSGVEIFTGQTRHHVLGDNQTNYLSLRLAPILDNRVLEIPRITRITRPFQMEINNSENISVTVDSVKPETSAVKGLLDFRFRSVDNQSLPLDNISGGWFNPDTGTVTDNGSGYPDILTTYNASGMASAQDLQVRVSNELEIGVTASFKVYVTGPIESETIVDTNPVIESLEAERVGGSQLQWTVLVSDDDPFSSLAVFWDYRFGDNRTFSSHTVTELSDTGRAEIGVGLMTAVMEGYQDGDDGMLEVTVCETDTQEYLDNGSCYSGITASTTVQFELIPYAYQAPIICEGWNCTSTDNATTASTTSVSGRIVAISSGTSPTTQLSDNLTSSGWNVGASNVVQNVWLPDNGTYVNLNFKPQGITYVDGQYLAVDSNGSWSSSDGVNWNFQNGWDNSTSYFYPTGIESGNGRIVAISSGSSPTTQWSDNLTSSGWNAGAFNVVQSVWLPDNGSYVNMNFYPQGITFDSGQFVAVDSNGSWNSSDGVSWYFQASWDNASSYFYPTGVASGNGRIVAISSGTNPTTQWSDNLTSSGWNFGASNVVQNVWTPDNGTYVNMNFYPKGITYADGQFLAVDNNGSWTSFDGVNWSFQAAWDNASSYFYPTGVAAKQ